MLLLSQRVMAQKPVEEDNACVLNLESANELYRQGKIELISDQLLPCLVGNRLSKENKVRAYRLLVITQLYFNEKQRAADYMVELLKLEPEYEINENTDPTEFIQLYKNFRTKPVLLIGIKAGGNYASPQVENNFSLDNTANSLGEYEANLGYSAALSLEVPLLKFLSIGVDFQYSLISYEYNKKQFNYSQVTFIEEQSWVEAPAYLKFEALSGDFKIHAKAGAAIHYLLNSKATVSRLDSLNEELGNQTVAGPRIDITSQRNEYYLSVIAGIGMSWKGVIGNGYLTADIGYSYGLGRINKASERYSNDELIYEYNYIDNNFSLDRLNFSIGYALPIYKPKLLKRKRN